MNASIPTAYNGSTVSVNYHGLPGYLRRKACRIAKARLGLALTDLMMGRAEFTLSPRDPHTGMRDIIEVIRTSIA